MRTTYPEAAFRVWNRTARGLPGKPLHPEHRYLNAMITPVPGYMRRVLFNGLSRILLVIVLLLSGLQKGHAQGNPDYFLAGPDKHNLCANSLAEYVIVSTFPVSRTQWTIAPGSTAWLINPDSLSTGVQFFAPGTYTLTATSITPNGTFLTDSMTIVVTGLAISPQVTGCYTISPVDSCYRVCAHARTVVSLPNPGTNAEIAVTGAATYSFMGPGIVEITWGAGGEGSVTFFSNGCRLDLCFVVLPEPQAAFSTFPAAIRDTIVVCKEQEIAFANHSLHGLHFTWSFGDDSQSSAFNGTHAYSAEGFYTVTLEAAGICDCRDQAEVVVNVLPTVAPMIDCIHSVCPGTRQHYTATPSGCSVYNWSVSPNGTIVRGGGADDDFIEVIWQAGPDGFVSLAADGCSSSGCPFVSTFRVPVVTSDGPIAGDQRVCSGELVTYTAPSFPGAVYEWTVGPGGTILGDESHESVTVKWAEFNVASTSFVKVAYDHCFLGCSGKDSLSVMMTTEITLTGDRQVCQGASATVRAHAGFVSTIPVPVDWSLENSTGDIVASSSQAEIWTLVFPFPPGEYTWVARNSSAMYCAEEVRMTLEVTGMPPKPLGIAGETEICPGIPYGYTIEAAGTYGTIWTVTDGPAIFTYSGQACRHTFGPTPPYKVQAVHFNIQYDNCQSEPVSITLSPVSSPFIEGPGETCLYSIDSFSTTAVNGASYAWEVIPADHAELRTDGLNRVTIFWTQPGSALLRLQACGTVIEKQVMIHAPPDVQLLGPLQACPGQTVTLTTDQPALLHQWSNIAGTWVSTTPSADLIPDTYHVRVTNSFGCDGELTFRIEGLPLPGVYLSSPDQSFYCNQLPAGVNIYANTDGAGYQFQWFRNDTLVAGSGPVFLVPDFGSYHVAVTNPSGCAAVSDPIRYMNCCPPETCGSPGGSSGWPSGCTFLPIDFMIEVGRPMCNMHEYIPRMTGIVPGETVWSITSSSAGVLAVIRRDTLTYVFEKPGYYFLEAISLLSGFPYGAGSCGHYQTFVDTIRTVADFRHTGVCAGDSIRFEDLTTFLPGETIADWAWDFGDPASGTANSSDEQHATHVFAAEGTYVVTLNITLASGCRASHALPVTIRPHPSLAPVYLPVHCEDEALPFFLPGDMFDVRWTFGDAASGSQNTAKGDSVLHNYTAPGNYIGQVSAADAYGCTSQASIMADIVPNLLSGLIGVDPGMILCAGDSATLTAPAGGLSWLWSTGEQVASIGVSASDQYSVWIRDAYACSYAPPPVFITLQPKPEVIIRAREILGPGNYGPWSSTLHLCEGVAFELSAFSTSFVEWSWVSGETTRIIQFTDESGNLPNPGLHEFGIQVTDLANHCLSDTAFLEVEIYPLPDPPFITLTSGPACSQNENVLSVTNPGPGMIYLWSDGQTGPSVTVREAGSYSVQAISPQGCSRSSNLLVIQPSARLDVIPGGCFIACDPLEVCLPGLADVTSFTLYRDGTPVITGSTWPQSYLIDVNGSYTFEVTTANGCSAVSDPLEVVLYPAIGSITVQTWLDLDGDEMISSADTLLPGIEVMIVSDDGLQKGKTTTIPGGQFVFADYPAGGYMALIDPGGLSTRWKILIDSVHNTLETCDDNVVLALLLSTNCLAEGPDLNIQACRGDTVMVNDSIWTDIGTYTMHMASLTGCDSVFEVVITLPDSLAIEVAVWMDVDRDGRVSTADTAAGGIGVLMTSSVTGSSLMGFTDVNGRLITALPVGGYQVAIDTSQLPAGIGPVIFSAIVADTACGIVTLHFLVESLCPDVTVIRQPLICPGDSLLIENIWLYEAGSYTFTLNDPVTGCDTTLDIRLGQLQPPVIHGRADWDCTSLGTIDLDIAGVPPFLIEWQGGLPGDTLIDFLEEGMYTVSITDGQGCASADSFVVTASERLSFTIQPVFIVPQGDSVLMEIGGDVQVPGLTFNWSPAAILTCSVCSSTFAAPASDTSVVILITDAEGCTYRLEATLRVSLADQLFIPNVFSPNGDGINDMWTLHTRLPNARAEELLIYDRWGSLVFARSDFNIAGFSGWDGSFRGKPLDPGVFTYITRLTLGDGKSVGLKGDITLLR